MVDEQLAGRGITDDRVLEAMGSVPRELFVGDRDRRKAYRDMPLRIGHGQTISQPYMVAVICQAAEVRDGDSILDIGTGSGYQAAVLAELGANVHTIERIPELAERARPYGATVESPLHPGLDWVRRRVHGDALDIGLGFVGLDPSDPDRVLPVPQLLLDNSGIKGDDLWLNAVVYLERMGRVAAERMQRSPDAPLRPMGDCDVVTLLASLTFRAAVVAGEPDGMRAVAVPMRNRGWLDLNRVDPAFSAAAARLTGAEERGFTRPLLVTRDEVQLAPEGGDVVTPVLQDGLAQVIDLRPRDVVYHRF